MRWWSEKPLRIFLTLCSAETREAPGETLVKPFASHRSFYHNKVELNLKNWEDFYAGAVLVVLRSSTSTPTSTSTPHNMLKYSHAESLFIRNRLAYTMRGAYCRAVGDYVVEKGGREGQGAY